MPRPYQYRDYPLTLFMAFIASAGVAWIIGGNLPERVEVSVAEQCCGDADCPTVAALAEIPSVTDVRHKAIEADHKIYLKVGRDVTARAIWDALELTDHHPAKLIFGGREFNVRPTP